MSQIINIALSQFSVTEKPGKKHNPIILNYFKEIGHTWVTTDETAWCSAYINWAALKAEMIGSGKLNARSWLDVGDEILVPKLGDVVIFWRDKKSSWKGHVGFFIGYTEDKKHINVLGGNQSNQVNIKTYPTHRLLGFRRLHAINTKK